MLREVIAVEEADSEPLGEKPNAFQVRIVLSFCLCTFVAIYVFYTYYFFIIIIAPFGR